MGKVTKSGQNNITSPAGNSLAVFVDGVSGVLKLKDIRGNIEPMSNYVSGSGGTPSLQQVVTVGNTITVPDVTGAKAILVKIGGLEATNVPDGFVVDNQGHLEQGGAGGVYSFVSYLKNKDNISFRSNSEGSGGIGFHAFINESSDQSGKAFLLSKFPNEYLFEVDELGNLIAKSVSITGGTSEQYLMADGSLKIGGSAPVTITKTEIDTLISTNSLVAGTLYEISGVHPTLYNDGTNSGTTIYLQAITNNKLSSLGNGIFYNPKYDKNVSGFGIWDNKSSWLATLQSQIVSSILGITENDPTGIVIDADGNLYTTNQGSNNVSKITPSGVSTILGTTGISPCGITIDADGNVYTTNQGSNNVSKITPLGVSTILGTTESAPFGITIDDAGNIYTTNIASNNVSKITPLGVSTILGTTGVQPYGITIDIDGNIYTANQGSNNVSKITPSGVSTILGTTETNPYEIVIDTTGNVYTANFGSNNVSKITPSGVSTILGTTGDLPRAITIDGAGNIYTSNIGSNNVSKITQSGVSTILGTTETSATGIVIDIDGNIYTANIASNNVSKIGVGFIQFSQNELITANNGATGQLFQTLDWNQFIAISGDWSSATSITGNATGALANVTDIVLKSYTIDGKAIWGGYSWTNTTGNVGQSIDVLNLDPTDWSKDTYDEDNYNQVLDLIEYDYENDWIYKRSNKDGIFVEYSFDTNEFLGMGNSSISTIQWGNGYTYNDNNGGSFNNIVNNGYVEDVNFQGLQNNNNTYGQNSNNYNNTYGQNSNNSNNTYEQYSNNYNNIYGQNSQNDSHTYGQNSMNSGNTYGKGSYNSSNTYEQYSNNYNNIYGENSRNYNNTYEHGSSNYRNTYEQNSNNYNNTYGQNSNNSNNTYEQYSNNYSNTYGQGSLNSSNTYPNSFNFKFNTIEAGTEIDVVNFTGATLVSADFSKTIYKRPDGTNVLRYYNNSNTLVFSDITA